MARYFCSNCHEVVEAAALRFAFCPGCGAPLAAEDMVTFQPVRPTAAVPEAAPVAEG